MKPNVQVVFLAFAFLLLSACASLIPIKVGPPSVISLETTPDRLTRGEYLANSVMFCIHCHSENNWNYFSGPVQSGTEGMGGEAYVEPFGTIYASNITPAALGDWTDGELVQAITEGVNREKMPLFPIMPSSRYKNMDTEDVYSVVVYLRSLKPISNTIPEKVLKFPFNHIERTFPEPFNPMLRPAVTDKVVYGEYLSTIADCISCHTPRTKSAKPIEGLFLAGGFEFQTYGGGIVRSSNITPDDATGIGSWDEEVFIDRFTDYAVPHGGGIPVEKDKNTVMPWSAYVTMTEEDLSAIYAYLRSVAPVKNNVNEWGVE